ncbi:uracil permease [Bifidobacterium anseris]|uniref:Uracil permease n=1 Tax=Bifidobacterium anseris TaxID=2020963 RepID=A0A2N5J2A3_9BIFI|nr:MULTISPECIES: nucleobase:cation symporter-2 family protein [Bifidobacterium]PLS28337.1 uracil permease [Bifidobacterium anseris]
MNSPVGKSDAPNDRLESTFETDELKRDEATATPAEERREAKRSGVSFETLSSLDAPVSFWKGIPFGLQHVLAMFVANLAPIFLVAAAGNMSAADSAKIIQSGLLVAGLGTCLQLYGVWRFGSRLPMVTGISFTYVAAAIAIVSHQGYDAVVGAVIVGGLLEVALGLTAKYWQRFVPPIVSAIVVTAIGFSLLSVGAESFGGGAGAKDFGSWQNLTLGLISLVACLVFQLCMKGTAKQLSVLFGLLIGYVVAIFFGKVDFSGFQHLQVVSVPSFMPFKPEFDWGAIISIGLLYVVSSVEVLGDTAALTKVGLDRKPTQRETSGAIAGDGLISSVSGVFGCLPLTSFAQNIGLVAMTKVVNRKVILSGGVLLILASFVPAISEVFNSMPQAVLGGCTIMMFGNIILSGFQMISDAGYTQRNITIAALSLTIGIGFTQVSSIFEHFPPLFQSIFASNCIAVAFVVAVILNLCLPGEERFLSTPKQPK